MTVCWRRLTFQFAYFHDDNGKDFRIDRVSIAFYHIVLQVDVT